MDDPVIARLRKNLVERQWYAQFCDHMLDQQVLIDGLDALASRGANMDAKRIESRLRLHIANVALAAVGRKEGDLREAKDALVREVERIAFDAKNEARGHSR